MSEAMEHVERGQEERPVLVRAFGVHAELAAKDTLDVRVVPYDEIGQVADPPDFKKYREQWMPGVFSNQERAANRVLLRFRHDALDDDGYRKPGLAGVVGHGLTLREASDGTHGSFKLHNTNEAEVARALLEDTDSPIRGVSAEFIPIRSVRTKDGVVQRVKAHLDSVALAFTPVYSKAQILALREDEVMIDEEMLPPPPPKALLERCQKLGIEIPENMAAILSRAYTEIAWDGNAGRWDTAAAYCAASAIDLNPSGQAKTKDRCHLPYKEPGSGDININAVRNALSRLGAGEPTDATQAQRDAARTMFERLLASFNQN